ncbi:MAG: Zn-ribbon domain-containing OB-fold protein [Azonexus sp.]|nr:Zn-ribbon domain-containing OB-fold protein [Azonexus sp.]
MADMRPEQEFFEFLEAGRFMIQRCRDSGHHIFYPRVAEPMSGSSNLEWVEASGEGVVYSVTHISQKPPTPSYNVALIDLAEGPRMMSRVDGIAAEEVKIGMRVKARVVRENDKAVVVFEPA